MPKVFQNSYFDQLSPDNQTANFSPLGLDFAAFPPKERARVIDLGQGRYGVPEPAAPPLNFELLNDSLTDFTVNPAQSLSLGAPRGVTNVARTGADLTGLIHNLFNTDLGDKVQPQHQNVLTDLSATYKVLAGAALAANQGPQSAKEAGSTEAQLGKAREEAGRLAAFTSQ